MSYNTCWLWSKRRSQGYPSMRGWPLFSSPLNVWWWSPAPAWGWKRSKKNVQHKIEGFYDQSTINNFLHHILILLQETIRKVTLDIWLIIPFLTFEWPNTPEYNWWCTKQSGFDWLFSAVNTCWPHNRSYNKGQRGTICLITWRYDV